MREARLLTNVIFRTRGIFFRAIICSLFVISSVAITNGQFCTVGPNVIVDGGFETGGIPNTFWNPETSTNFGTPLCDVPSCGTGGGASPPRTGAFWLWFGGIPAAETATLGQTVNIAAGSIAALNFWLRVGTVSAPATDVLNVRVDGAIVASFPEPAAAEGAYTLRQVNMTPFANGAAHAILFEYIGPTTGTSSYVIDDVQLNVCPISAAGASISGRVLGPNGSGVPKATVSMSDVNGTTRVARTGPFGYYRFDDVATGQTYFLSVSSKAANYQLRVLTVGEDMTDIDFTPQQ
jgi:hypothetical protein